MKALHRALLLYLVIMFTLFLIKPALLFLPDGAMKQFGRTSDESLITYQTTCVFVGAVVYGSVVLSG